MSTLKVDSITSRLGDAPSFPDGVSVTGVVTATTFKKSGGTSSQYLMADGSTSSGGGGGGINNVVEDTTPQLGGDLDLNGNDITGTGNVTATSFSGSGSSLTGLTGASAATYGDASNSAQIVVDANGRITGITNVSISGGGGGGGGSGSGLGLFNSSVNGAAGYTVTTSNAAGFTAPNTAGSKYIVHSIQVTNTHATNSGNLSVDINGTNYSAIHLAKTIPLDPGLTIELLKRPKIIHPSNAIRFLSDVNSILKATITYQSTTEAKYFGQGISLSNTSTTDLYAASADSVVESILLSNVEGVSDVKATVEWTNASNANQGYYVYELVIPADATVEILEAPKFIQNTYKVRVTANVGGRLHAIVAGITV